MHNPNARIIAKWLFTEIICRHGVFGEVKVNGGPKFRGNELVDELGKFGIKRLVISPYNAKANGGIEVGHKPFIAALITLTLGRKKP